MMKPAINVETAQCNWLNLGFNGQGWMVTLRSLLKTIPDASEGRLRVGLQENSLLLSLHILWT